MPDYCERAKRILSHKAAVSKEAWKTFSKEKVPFLAVPPEIQLNIFEFLSPIDAVYLSPCQVSLQDKKPTLIYD
jgi:hypothetical protein